MTQALGFYLLPSPPPQESNSGSAEPMRVIVAGSRGFTDQMTAFHELDKLFEGKAVEVVSGRAPGADLLGELWAEARGHALKCFPAEWDLHGKAAGYLRNIEMAKYAREQEEGMLVAFWNGTSRGTAHMIQQARDMGLEVVIISVENTPVPMTPERWTSLQEDALKLNQQVM